MYILLTFDSYLYIPSKCATKRISYISSIKMICCLIYFGGISGTLNYKKMYFLLKNSRIYLPQKFVICVMSAIEPCLHLDTQKRKRHPCTAPQWAGVGGGRLQHLQSACRDVGGVSERVIE